MNKVSKNQVQEWVENPVTIAVADHFKWELETIVASEGLNSFHPFQANRTQEILSSLNGASETLERCVEVFTDADELISAFQEEDFKEEDDDGNNT